MLFSICLSWIFPISIIVNVVYYTVLATSGIDYDVKLWSPTAEVPNLSENAAEASTTNEHSYLHNLHNTYFSQYHDEQYLTTSPRYYKYFAVPLRGIISSKKYLAINYFFMSKKLCKDTEIKAFSHWHFEFSMARFWAVPVFSNKVWTVWSAYATADFPAWSGRPHAKLTNTKALLTMEKYFSIHVLGWSDKGTGVG